MRRQEFEDLLVDEFGEAFTRSYFERSGFSEGVNPILYPWSYVAEGKFTHEARAFLKRHGVKLGPPILEHLKHRQKRAAE